MTDFNPAPYMRWAKTRPRPDHDLAGSNLLPVTPGELPGLFAEVDYEGPNDDGYPPLLEAIAARYGVESRQVATAAGCSGANFLVCAAFLRRDDDAVVEHPVYDPLTAAARLVGANVIAFERNFADDWAIDPERVAWSITPGTRLIVLSSPHNPSGVVATDEALRAVGELAQRIGAWVLVDEVYLDTIRVLPPVPSARLHPRLISTSSLTKSYGLAGLRCGWAIAAPEAAERIRRVRDAVDAVGAFPAEMASLRAFARLDRLAARAHAIVRPNFERLRGFVASRPELEWVPPGGGTVAFPRLTGVPDAGPFVDRLLREHGTAVVPGRFFDAPSHFRVAYGVARETLDHGLEAIGKALDRGAGL